MPGDGAFLAPEAIFVALFMTTVGAPYE